MKMLLLALLALEIASNEGKALLLVALIHSIDGKGKEIKSNQWAATNRAFVYNSWFATFSGDAVEKTHNPKINNDDEMEVNLLTSKPSLSLSSAFVFELSVWDRDFDTHSQETWIVKEMIKLKFKFNNKQYTRWQARGFNALEVEIIKKDGNGAKLLGKWYYYEATLGIGISVEDVVKDTYVPSQ